MKLKITGVLDIDELLWGISKEDKDYLFNVVLKSGANIIHNNSPCGDEIGPFKIHGIVEWRDEK